jgi:hypothetical protein
MADKIIKWLSFVAKIAEFTVAKTDWVHYTKNGRVHYNQMAEWIQKWLTLAPNDWAKTENGAWVEAHGVSRLTRVRSAPGTWRHSARAGSLRLAWARGVWSVRRACPWLGQLTGWVIYIYIYIYIHTQLINKVTKIFSSKKGDRHVSYKTKDILIIIHLWLSNYLGNQLIKQWLHCTQT